ncbi:hypothetical protein GJ496_008220 [Pomphorhynchus laevis]|nr:hypothetical protein GJ496_008220 [Pomphorhynchus laevis]
MLDNLPLIERRSVVKDDDINELKRQARLLALSAQQPWSLIRCKDINLSTKKTHPLVSQTVFYKEDNEQSTNAIEKFIHEPLSKDLNQSVREYYTTKRPSVISSIRQNTRKSIESSQTTLNIHSSALLKVDSETAMKMIPFLLPYHI